MDRNKHSSRKIGTRVIAGTLSAVFLFSAVSGTALMAGAPFSTVAQAATSAFSFAKGSTVQATDSLNLRSGAGGSYSVKEVLAKGTKLTVTAKNTGSWVAVRTAGGKTGYVSVSYLKPVLSQVTGLKAIKKTETTLKLQFSSVTNATGYKIYDAETGEVLAKATTQNGASTIVKTVTGLKPGETRKYKVRAYATLNEMTTYGAYSAVYSKATAGTAAAPTVTLEKVTGLKAIKKTETTLKLQFDKVENADGYEIYDAESNTRLTTSTTQNGVNPLTKTVTGLKAGETRKYKVRAYATVNGKTVYGAFSDVYTKATAAAASSNEKLEEYVTTDALNYRTAPDLQNSSKAGTLSTGTTVYVVSGSAQTAAGVQWVKIKKDGNYYYVAAEYLKKPGDEPEQPSGEKLVEYTTTEAVKYRTAPGTASTEKGILVAGTVVDVVSGYSKKVGDYTWFKIKIGNSYYYIASEYLEKGAVGTEVSVPKLKTLYLSGYTNGTWKSSDESVATVVKGFVYGVKAGTATITCTSGNNKKVWNVTVKSAAAVKLAYVTPNVASVGEKVTFVAVTDTSRKAVQFTVNGKNVVVTDYETETAEAKNGFAATKSRIWKYTTSFSKAGTYTAQIRSSTKADGSGMSSSYYTTDAFVVSTENNSASSVENRRISDEGLNVIASWEGYYPTVYLDPLTSTVVPTVGYGHTFSAGDTFYNNLTKTEAWALLCDVINKGNYTKQVNLFITQNKIRANQRQFDAMVSFSYNCGSGYWNGTYAFDLRVFLLNAVNPKSVQAKIDGKETVTGVTSFKTQVYKSKKQTGTGSATIAAGRTVTIQAASWDSATKAAWYKVKAGNVTGYVPAPYVSITSHSFEKNMNYMDAITFGSELLQWNKAGGVPIAGLVYRRLGEAKLFSYGDYDAAKNNSSEKGKNTYNYIVPSDIANKGWLR